MNELDLAAQISRGEVASPVAYGNSFLVPMRITGTGVAWRPAHKEFVCRPETWLGLEIQRRCLAMPIVAEHPPGDLLTAQSLGASILGIVTFTFVRGSELWCVGRLFSEEIAKAITSGDLVIDTSPSVTFAPDQMATVTLVDGSVLRVEGTPDLIDHLAICNLGVWSKGGPATGIDTAESGQ